MLEDRVIALIAEADPAVGFVSSDGELREPVRERVMAAIGADRDASLVRSGSDLIPGRRLWLRRRVVSMVALFVLSLATAFVVLGAFGVLARAHAQQAGGSARVGSTHSDREPFGGDEAQLAYAPVIAFLRFETRKQMALVESAARAAARRLGSGRAADRRRLVSVLGIATDELSALYRLEAFESRVARVGARVGVAARAWSRVGLTALGMRAFVDALAADCAAVGCQRGLRDELLGRLQLAQLAGLPASFG